MFLNYFVWGMELPTAEQNLLKFILYILSLNRFHKKLLNFCLTSCFRIVSSFVILSKLLGANSNGICLRFFICKDLLNIWKVYLKYSEKASIKKKEKKKRSSSHFSCCLLSQNYSLKIVNTFLLYITYFLR